MWKPANICIPTVHFVCQNVTFISCTISERCPGEILFPYKCNTVKATQKCTYYSGQRCIALAKRSFVGFQLEGECPGLLFNALSISSGNSMLFLLEMFIMYLENNFFSLLYRQLSGKITSLGNTCTTLYLFHLNSLLIINRPFLCLLHVQ